VTGLRVLFITQYFPPEIGAAPTRAAHFARALARRGHRVTVVTGLPNHPGGVKDRQVGPGVTRWEDLELRRAWLFATPRKNPLTRLWNHLSFAISALPAAWKAGPQDVVLVTTPPLFVGVTARLVAALRRAPLVLDCRDDWPHAAIAVGEMRPGWLASMLGALAGSLYNAALRVVCANPGMARRLPQRGVDQGRVVLITNGADTDVFRPSPLPERRNGEPAQVLYSGTHGLIHGMDTLLEAVERLRGRSDIRFVLVGDGVTKQSLEARAQRHGLANLEFHASLPPAQLAEVIRESDLCVATMMDHPFCDDVIPVKVFDYLAAGRPVVAGARGDTAHVVESSGGGVLVPPGDAAALARAVVELVEDPERRRRLGESGARHVREHYARNSLGDRLAAVVEDVQGRSRGRAVAPRPGGLHGALKRGADLLSALLAVVVLLPVFVLIAALVRLDSAGPAFFRQRRVGRGSSEFIMLKFRTMRAGTPDLASHLVGPGSSYVTRLGRFLRRTSLDELPQLFNILRGHMSLVGPRPALFNQDDLIAMRQGCGVDALRPGVTGWAQIHGRDDIPLDLKVQLDRAYLDRVSPALDLVILFRTVATLFSPRGVY
jgi:lipopolysaccharide/colanic/teichoic acid biosynthesis glycosyltransferase/glycosyltransferase involved in cell wall biosynthesis